MALSENDVAICNQALASFGARPIQTFDDTTPAGSTCRLKYQEVIDGLLSEHPWSFTRQIVQLQELAEDAPDLSGFLASGWRHAYALPPDLLAAPSAYLRDPSLADFPERRFQVMGQSVYLDVTPVWAVCRVRVDPAFWPPYFTSAAVACLSAELVMPISGNAGFLAAKQQEAWGSPSEGRRGGKLGVARSADARDAGNRVLMANPLVDARRA